MLGANYAMHIIQSTSLCIRKTSDIIIFDLRLVNL